MAVRTATVIGTYSQGRWIAKELRLFAFAEQMFVEGSNFDYLRGSSVHPREFQGDVQDLTPTGIERLAWSHWLQLARSGHSFQK